MILNKALSSLVIGLLLVGTGAKRPQDDDIDEKELAEINLDDGGTVKFVEADEGVILMIENVPDDNEGRGGRSLRGSKDDDEDDELSPTEQFAKLTKGEDPPPELVEAEARMKRKVKDEKVAAGKAVIMHDIEPELEEDDGPDGGRQLWMGCWSFQNSYCEYYNNEEWDWCFCNAYTGGYVTNYDNYIRTTVYTQQGYIRHRLCYKSWWSWKCTPDYTGPGTLSIIKGWGWAKWRARTDRVSYPDKYHWAVYVRD